MRIDPMLKGQLREDMHAELRRVEDGHSCKGWNAWLQGRAKDVYDVHMTWRVADRLRRRLVEELQQAGVRVVRVGQRVHMAVLVGDYDQAVAHHYRQAMGHLRAVQRIKRLAPSSFRKEVYRELEALFLEAEEEK